MSITQMTKVFKDKRLTPTRKLIMLVLADNANDSGVCFPSINTIKNKSNLSTGAVSDNLKWLIANSFLFKKHRSRKKGGRSSNKYLVYPIENRDILDEEDYLLFEDLYTQIPSDDIGIQIPSDDIGVGIQIPSDGIESEPSLKDLTITYAENIYSYYKTNIKASTHKQQCINNISKWLKDFNEEELIRAIDNYMPKAKQQQDKKYIKDCKNFFGTLKESNGFFKDYLVANDIEPTLPNGNKIPNWMK